MNVSATTLVANTAKVGSTNADRTGTITSGTVTTIGVTDTAKINGNVKIKTTLEGPTIEQINQNNTNMRTSIQKNITDLDSLDLRKLANDSLYQSVSGNYYTIVNTEFPTQLKILDLSGKCEINETNIIGVSNDVYTLEIANSGGYPNDTELEDLSGRVDKNVQDVDRLFIRVYGVIDETLDGNLVSVTDASEIELRIIKNENNIQDASEGYAYAYNNANILATQTNYDDLSERTIDVSNSIAFLIGEINPYGFNDVSNRNEDLSQNTKYVEDLCNGLLTDIKYQTPRIADLSQNVSVISGGIMFGVSANAVNTGVTIGEDLSRNLTYFNSKVNDIYGETTISGTAYNIIQPKSTIDTDFVASSRDVSSIIVDFTSNTPYVHTHHILLDPSEGVVMEPNLTEPLGDIFIQSDGGIGLDLRISRLSKSRRIIVTIPPACASRFTVTLYDDDKFTTVSGGYDISDERLSTAMTNMSAYKNILTGTNLPNENLYRLRDSIQVSPACAPSIDVSFLNLNSTQKSSLVTLLELDTYTKINPTGVSRLQYQYNPMIVNQNEYHGGSMFHIVRDVSEIAFVNAEGSSDGNYQRLRNLSSMNETDGIITMDNDTLNGLPSFLMNQTFERESNGNRFDVIFGGASRLVHYTSNNPPLIAFDEIASPFDYYGGNSYTFEINLVSTGRPEDRDLAKIYITEKTRQAPLRRFYKSSFFGDVNNINGISDGFSLSNSFDTYKLARRSVYNKLIANPSVATPIP